MKSQYLTRTETFSITICFKEPLFFIILFLKGLDISRHVKNLKKAAKLLSLSDMFRQKLLSSSVNYCTKRWKLNYIISRTMLVMMNSDNKKIGKA